MSAAISASRWCRKAATSSRSSPCAKISSSAASSVRNDAAKVRQLMDGDVCHVSAAVGARASQNAGTLSGGEQQMLVLGRAMMSEPQLLCLDEPSLGLAPIDRAGYFPARSARSTQPAPACCWSSRMRAMRFETASRGYVLQTGSIIASGSCAELKLRIARVQRGLSRPHRGGCGVMTHRRQIFARGQIRRSSPAPATASAAPLRSLSRRPARTSPASIWTERRQRQRPRAIARRRRSQVACDVSHEADRSRRPPKRSRPHIRRIDILLNGAAGQRSERNGAGAHARRLEHGCSPSTSPARS